MYWHYVINMSFPCSVSFTSCIMQSCDLFSTSAVHNIAWHRYFENSNEHVQHPFLVFSNSDAKKSLLVLSRVVNLEKDIQIGQKTAWKFTSDFWPNFVADVNHSFWKSDIWKEFSQFPISLVRRVRNYSSVSHLKPLIIYSE